MTWQPKTHFSRPAGSGEEYVASSYSPGLPLGNVYYVCSGLGVDSYPDYGFSPESPFATLSFAISKCRANCGDVIYLLPGHAENIGSAGAINVNVAGVTIIGVGRGSERATFTWSNTAGTIVVSAADVTLSNFVTTVSVDEVVSMFSVTASGATFDGVDFVEYASGQAIQWLLTSGAPNYLTVKNCVHYQATAAGSAQKWIQLAGGKGHRILDNRFDLTANAATGSQLIAGTTAVSQVEIARNVMTWLGATVNTVVNLVTTSTGMIHDNRARSGTSVSTSSAFTCDACGFQQNYWLDSSSGSALLAPAVGTDT